MLWAVLLYFGCFCLLVLVLNLDKVAAGVRRLWGRIRGRHFIREMRKYL
jgi:hypothetical protein